MRSLKWTIYRVVAVAICLLSSACALSEKDKILSCPAVLILKDAQNLTRFKPGSTRDVTDILFEAEIFNFRGQCDYDEDGEQWKVDVDLLVEISVERGPANHGRNIEFEYFVVLPGFEGKAGGKQIFSVKGEFDRGMRRQVYRDEVEVTIPLESPIDVKGAEIVLGFQLSPDELKFNRGRLSQ